MGLSIKKYHYSYSYLHDLRSAALKVDGLKIKLKCALSACDDCFYCTYTKNPDLKTNFANFIYYCDCSGGYISKKSKQLNKPKYKGFGDLDELKRECKILNRSIRKYLNEREINAWNDYYSDVMSSRMILIYR
jgi:hypothetical protein